MRFGEPTPSRSSGVIVAAFRPKPVLANRLRGLVDDLVLARAPGLQREVEPREFEVEPGHLGSQDAEALLEQLLPGFVALEHHDRFGVHGSGH